MKHLVQSLRMLVVFTLLTGMIYPLVVTGLARALFPTQSAGSLVFDAGGNQPVGSALLAQKFTQPKYFWPRPSAGDFATLPSGASNKGPTSVDLVKAIADNREKFGAAAPVDLLTASGSGLDPHVSPAAALLQAARVADTRKIPRERIEALVKKFIEPPQLGLFGEPRVNVLLLNRALDEMR
ncbi:MAG: potassium-transporting ATPase subunit KdpC [Verrucomicrobia bacterium]|nr:potassium-transporting ATPase subunit KdpC [Verrucomicrobiota bacterium]